MTEKQRQMAEKDFENWWLFTFMPVQNWNLIQRDAKDKIKTLYFELVEERILCEKMDTELGKWMRGEVVEGYETVDKREET